MIYGHSGYSATKVHYVWSQVKERAFYDHCVYTLFQHQKKSVSHGEELVNVCVLDMKLHF